jgi:hypothetical protein
VRLSPKSVFIALVLLGSPFAVTVGWQLAAPAVERTAQTVPGDAAGAGGIGAAPVVSAPPSRPVTAVVDWSAPSPSPSTSGAVPSLPSRSPGPNASSAAPSVAPDAAPGSPSLSVPPVPTPTSAEPDPSASAASPSGEAASASVDLDPVRLLHKP